MIKPIPCKIGVIGAGRWGRNIVRTLHELDCLAGIADCDPKVYSDMSNLYPEIPIFSNYQDLLAENISAVTVVTPVSTHYEIAKSSLLAGKDVFVEKPMTIASTEAEVLVNLAKQRKHVLMTGHMLLYQPAIQFIKKFINEKKLGNLLSVHQVRRNLGVIRTNENVLYCLGVHDFAVLQYLVDSPLESIQHIGQSIITKDIEDDVTVHFNFTSGVQAHLHVCWFWPVKDRQMMVLGDKGALHYDELAQTVTFHRNHGNPDATVTNDGSEIVFSGNSEPLKLEMEHFIECVQNRQKPLSAGEHSVNIVRLLEQITQKRSHAT